MELLKNSKLPYIKSIKRIFYENSGLFFYLRECEIIYSLIKDVNLLFKILSSENIFYILASFHNYPGIIDFCSDYCKIKSINNFCFCIIQYSQELVGTAIRYYSLNEYARIDEQSKWTKNKRYFNSSYYTYLYANTNYFSIPLNVISENKIDCKIGRYKFKFLKNIRECHIAGNLLNNCLSEWQDYRNHIVIIYKSTIPVAAVEIKGNKILQFYGRSNKGIDKNSVLFDAYKKWCKFYKLINT